MELIYYPGIALAIASNAVVPLGKEREFAAWEIN